MALPCATDRASRSAFHKLYVVREVCNDASPSCLQISQLEFSRDRKMMSVRCRRQDQDTLFVKGAPEAVMARCTRVSRMQPAKAPAALVL